ncbi:type II secretion system F family protein [Candidatus Oleimmundimicrobium sp.]|uniref:type II secretion system F family protein n=1 Tax=Candidatus Oleimmundimicrobium sp. TaxID=3060597 RepID=UPI002718E51C|nr:type II secretion system F family protein [Candidatus Oleimmundimicrobium sp.]MDO8885585.1 type II secretion system F family protein [Candidatus Oleimmundimicrobium sp.]
MASTFTYKARDKQGKLITGALEGDNQMAVSAKLKQMGYIVIHISEKAESSSFSQILKRFKQVKSTEITVFSRQFATMINAGLSLTKCLAILTEQTENEVLSEVIDKVRKDVEGGNSLSDALAKYPKVFHGIFINMVKAGEAGGVLDDVLLRVADHYEREGNLHRKIKSAMAYPMAVFSFSVVLMFVMITFVVPIFKGMFDQMGAQLPLPTMVLLSISNFVQNFWYLVIVGAIGVIYAIKKFINTERGRFLSDSLKLKLPVFGELTKKIAISKFSRTLGTLLSSGVPILGALDIVADTSGNAIIARDIKEAGVSIKEGETISKPLSKSKVFPPMVVQMIAVGEETGVLDGMLQKIADFYDEEVSATVDTMTSLIEPFMLLGIGLMIGGMLIALYMPMFQVVLLMGE